MASEKETKFNDETVKLYIGGISTAWDSARLKDILGNNGDDIKRVDIVHNYAFAFVKDQQVADKIIEQVSGKTFEGSRLVVQISKNKQNLPDGDNLCFECGKPGHWAKDCAQRQERYRKQGHRRSDNQRNSSNQGSYGRGDPYSRGGDPYARDPYARGGDPYARDPYGRDPYGRDPYNRDPYSRGYYGRDPYARDPYYNRDPYYRDSYAGYRDAYPSYRERSPSGYNRARYDEAANDPYAEERRRLAYGTSAAAPTTPSAQQPAATGVPPAPAKTDYSSYNYASYAQQYSYPTQQAQQPPPPPQAQAVPQQSYQQMAQPTAAAAYAPYS